MTSFTKNKLPPMLRQVGDQLAFVRMLRCSVQLRFGGQVNFHRAFTAKVANQQTSTDAEPQNGKLQAFLDPSQKLFGRADGRWQFPDQSAAKNFYDQVFSGAA